MEKDIILIEYEIEKFDMFCFCKSFLQAWKEIFKLGIFDMFNTLNTGSV